MAAETQKEIQLEIAHVLFIDTVGYSKLSINEQRAVVDELTQIVRATEQFQKAEATERLIKISTGDGMALVFYTSPEAPVRCAMELSRALKGHPRLRLRMGIHSGPVSGVIDVTGRTNLAGAGINTAQRIMACGDAGHILVSKHVAEDLEEYDEWRPCCCSKKKTDSIPLGLRGCAGPARWNRRHRISLLPLCTAVRRESLSGPGEKHRGAAVSKFK